MSWCYSVKYTSDCKEKVYVYICLLAYTPYCGALVLGDIFFLWQSTLTSSLYPGFQIVVTPRPTWRRQELKLVRKEDAPLLSYTPSALGPVVQPREQPIWRLASCLCLLTLSGRQYRKCEAWNGSCHGEKCSIVCIATEVIHMSVLRSFLRSLLYVCRV